MNLQTSGMVARGDFTLKITDTDRRKNGPILIVKKSFTVDD